MANTSSAANTMNVFIDTAVLRGRKIELDDVFHADDVQTTGRDACSDKNANFFASTERTAAGESQQSFWSEEGRMLRLTWRPHAQVDCDQSGSKSTAIHGCTGSHQ